MTKEEIKEEINYSDNHSVITAALLLASNNRAAVDDIADVLFEFLQQN